MSASGPIISCDPRKSAIDAMNATSALSDLDRSIALLSPLADRHLPWPTRNLVGALVNKAHVLLDTNKPAEAWFAAAEGIARIAPLATASALDSELSLHARQALCDATGILLPDLPAEEQDWFAAYASDQANSGLALIRKSRTANSEEPFPEISVRLFRFGANLYANFHPELLEKFITEHLYDLDGPSSLSKFASIARQAIGPAIETINSRRYDRLATLESQDALAKIAESLRTLHQNLSDIPLRNYDLPIHEHRHRYISDRRPPLF